MSIYSGMNNHIIQDFCGLCKKHVKRMKNKVVRVSLSASGSQSTNN